MHSRSVSWEILNLGLAARLTNIARRWIVPGRHFNALILTGGDEMTPEPVEVVKPGHSRHGQRGMVVAKSGDVYTVEFVTHGPVASNYTLDRFFGRELRAVLRVRVGV